MVTPDSQALEQIKRIQKAFFQYEYYAKLVAEVYPQIHTQTLPFVYRYIYLPFKDYLTHPQSTFIAMADTVFADIPRPTPAPNRTALLMGGAFIITLEQLTFSMEFFQELQRQTQAEIYTTGMIRHIGATLLTLCTHEQVVATPEGTTPLTDIPATIAEAYLCYRNHEDWLGPNSLIWNSTS